MARGRAAAPATRSPAPAQSPAAPPPAAPGPTRPPPPRAPGPSPGASPIARVPAHADPAAPGPRATGGRGRAKHDAEQQYRPRDRARRPRASCGEDQASREVVVDQSWPGEFAEQN
ncbi:hypothetical protein ACRRTK_002930 [Alexandromys fortis]